MCSHAAIRWWTEFKTGDQTMLMCYGRGVIRRCNVQDTQMALEEAMAASLAFDACLMRQGTKTGAWITVLPSMVNGTDMGAQEWRNALFLCYGIDPPDLPTHCDG